MFGTRLIRIAASLQRCCPTRKTEWSFESGEWSLELGIRSEELGIVGKDMFIQRIGK